MTAKARWDSLSEKRAAVLERARKAASLTIPGLIPLEGQNDSMELPTPWQSLGARGVNNLASKILLALFPPGTSFARLSIEPGASADLEAAGILESEIEEKLAEVEKDIVRRIEVGHYRPHQFEAVKHLIVAGNVVTFMPKDAALRLYRLDQYVVLRDPMGNMIECVVKEVVAPSSLPEDVRALAGSASDDQKTVELYTHVEWYGSRVKYYQEVGGKKIPSSMGDHPKDKTPWSVLRWSTVAGEDYGRSLVMEYMGDLISLESLSEAIVKFSAAAAKVVYLLHSNSTTDEEDLEAAQSGDIITGNKEDIDLLTLDKYPDFQTADKVRSDIEQRLAQAFLLTSSTIRNAERVTAEEVRLLAQELEDVLGGVYTVLAQEMQLPFLNRLMEIMRRAGELPSWPKGAVRPIITTGFEALGRNHSVNSLRSMLADANELLGEQVVQRYVNVNDALTRLGTGYGVQSLKDLIRTDEQVAQMDAQAQQAALVQAAAPAAATAAGKAVTDAQTPPA